MYAWVWLKSLRWAYLDPFMLLSWGLCCWSWCLKCSFEPLLSTWLAQSLCGRKCAPAPPDCFTIGFFICSCCFPAIYFGATWWDIGRDLYCLWGERCATSAGILFLFIKARKENTKSSRETSFSKCTDIWYFCFCYFWMCTWRWHGFQSHYLR